MANRGHVFAGSIMLAYELSVAPLTIAFFLCFLTLPVGLLFVHTTPRLAMATVYWSVATFLVASPLIFDVPYWLFGSVQGFGTVLVLGLFLDYLQRRR